ncbi:hypothetical protein B9Z55_017952 [Caenorhabditis nigoni]|nr:hypothetical protein B9Z55_017952 [Caenorhabditis nigoni]
MSIKERLDNLLKADPLKNRRDITIPIHKIQITKEVDMTDSVFERISTDIQEHSSIRETDPVVVIVLNGEYHVVSGNRRIMALKHNKIPTIKACEIPSASRSELQLWSFFAESKKKDKDYKEFVDMSNLLLDYLNLTTADLRKWNAKEIALVFGDFLGILTKQRLIFEINLYSDLVSACCTAVDNNADFSQRLCLECLRKYKQNPSEVGNILKKEKTWNKDSELTTLLKKISPNIEYQLCQKNIDENEARILCEIFRGDELFSRFVRSADLRTIGKQAQRDSIIRRFNLFKTEMKKQQKSIKGSDSLQIRVEENPKEYDLLITSSEIVRSNVWSQKSSIVIITIGMAVPDSSVHTIHLPDSMAKEDESGKLNNHISLSIQAKYDGEEVSNGKDFSTFLTSMGVRNQTVFSLSDLKPLSSNKSEVFIDLNDLIYHEIVIGLLHHEASLIVKNTKGKIGLEKAAKEIRKNSS